MSHLVEVQRIFRDQFEDPALLISEETSPETLPEWDSVAQIQIILALEETFGFRFSTEEVARVHCVGDLLDAIKAHV